MFQFVVLQQQAVNFHIDIWFGDYVNVQVFIGIDAMYNV